MEHQNLEIASLKLRLEGALSREQTLKDELIELKSAWREVEAQLDVRTRQLKVDIRSVITTSDVESLRILRMLSMNVTTLIPH
jgi:hypothetical protein